MQSITWRSKYKDDFEEFWVICFGGNLKAAEVFQRFEYLNVKLASGPVLSWYNWLKNRFLIYCFVKFDFSIYELSQLSSMPVPKIGVVIRDFFLGF